VWGAEGYPEVARDRGATRCRGWGQRRSQSWRRGQAEAEGEVDARGLGRQGRRRACPWSKVDRRAWRRPQGATGGRGATEQGGGRAALRSRARRGRRAGRRRGVRVPAAGEWGTIVSGAVGPRRRSAGCREQCPWGCLSGTMSRPGWSGRRHGDRRRVTAVMRRERLQGWCLATWEGGRASRRCERRRRRSVWGTSRARWGRRTPWGSSRWDAGLCGDGGEERCGV